MSYPSDLRLIISGSPSHVRIPPYILTYRTLPIPIPLPMIPLPPHPPPTPLMHAPLLSIGHPDRSAPTTALIFEVLDSAPPPEKIPL